MSAIDRVHTPRVTPQSHESNRRRKPCARHTYTNDTMLVFDRHHDRASRAIFTQLCV